MISFRNDYSEGAHPQVLAALEKNNLITTCGYSMDCFCDEAKDIVRARFSCPQPTRRSLPLRCARGRA